MKKDKAIGVQQSEDSWQLLAVILFSKKEQGLDVFFFPQYFFFFFNFDCVDAF